MSSGRTTTMDSVPCGDVGWSKGDDLSCSKGYIAWAGMSEIGEPNIFVPPNPTHSLLMCVQKILCRRFDSLLASCDNWPSLTSSAPMPTDKSVAGHQWRPPEATEGVQSTELLISPEGLRRLAWNLASCSWLSFGSLKVQGILKKYAHHPCHCIPPSPTSVVA